jgi:hypothetical protein
MVETYGYTLEEIAHAFDRASTDSLTSNALLDREPGMIASGKNGEAHAAGQGYQDGAATPDGREPSDEYK